MRSVGGTPLSNKDVIPRLEKESGLPLFFSPELRNQIKLKNLEVIQEVMTVLRISHFSDWYPEHPDYSSQDAPTTFDPSRGSYKNLLHRSKEIVTSQNISIPKEVQDTHIYHMTTKKGPLGPALMTCLSEQKLDQFKLIRNHLFKLCSNLRPKIWLIEDVDEEIGLQDLPQEAPREGGSLRRLSVVKDPEGKLRVIAILDYWTQSVLHGIHNHIIHKLDKWFPGTDMTFNQGGFTSKLPDHPTTFFSFDLSKATDRFPMEFQKEIMSVLIGEEKSNSWKYLLTGIPYELPNGGSKEYKVGQPMGAYTSWAVFALCHHLVVRTAGYYSYGTATFDKYFLLGDDIVIYDEKVALIYKRQMTETQGVEMSPTKTMVSSDTFEFAKRIFHKGVEISPIPFDQLFSVTNPITVQSGFLCDYIIRSRASVVQDRRLIRNLLGLFYKSSSPEYSLIKSIWLETYQTLTTSRGYKFSPRSNDQDWIGISPGCGIPLAQYLEDVVEWDCINRLIKLIPKQTSNRDSLNKDLNRVRSKLGNIHHLSFPILDVLHSGGYKMSVFLDEIRLFRTGGSLGEQYTLLLEIEDLINIGSLDFRRRMDRVNLQIHRSCRRLERYQRYRNSLLGT